MAGLADGGDRITLTGVVDAAAGDRLGAVVAERLAERPGPLTLDLSGVVAIDEGGLVAIVRIWHELTTVGHPMTLLDPSPVVGPALSMTGLAVVYTDCDD